MGFSPGEESLAAAVAAQAIEAQPSFGEIKPGRGRVVRAERQSREKRWWTSRAARKRSEIPGEGKEGLAHNKDGVMTNHSGQRHC
jgi:hypothetical protein